MSLENVDFKLVERIYKNVEFGSKGTSLDGNLRGKEELEEERSNKIPRTEDEQIPHAPQDVQQVQTHCTDGGAEQTSYVSC